MSVESASYINQLDATRPNSSDLKSEGDNHLRLLKSTLQGTFPNVTGAVNPTHTQLNYVVGVTSSIQTQLDAKAPLASPALTGTPTVPTAATATTSTQAASTAFVHNVLDSLGDATIATATTQAGIATTQAGIATTQAGIATTQASNASSSASSASSSASSASSSASSASTSASTATTQAGIATTQATNAAASYDAFDDRYLGDKASNPSVDNDGNALLTGAIYWNTTTPEMRVYNGSSWVAVANTSISDAAAASASAASSSASAASTSASNASTSASNASTSASSAATSASTATTKASEANASAIAAAASAASISGGPVTSVNGRTGVVTGVQDSLVSGTSIKTVNGNSLMGSGDLTVGGGIPASGLTKTAESTVTFSTEMNFVSSIQDYLDVGSGRTLFLKGGLAAFHAVVCDSSNVFGASALIRTATFQNTGYPNFNALLIGTDKVLVVSCDSTTGVEAVVLTITGTSISVGTPVSFTLGSTRSSCFNDLIAVGSTYVYAYNRTTGYACVGITVSGTTPTFGSELALTGTTAAAGIPIQVSAVTSSVFLAFSASNGVAAYVQPISVSGTTLTAGTGASVASTASLCTTSKIAPLSSGRYAFIVPTSTTVISGAIVSVSGTTATVSSTVTLCTATSSNAELHVMPTGNQAIVFCGLLADRAFANVLTDNAGVAVGGTPVYYTNSFQFYPLAKTSTELFVSSSNGGVIKIAVSGNNPAATYHPTAFAGTAGIPTFSPISSRLNANLPSASGAGVYGPGYIASMMPGIQHKFNMTSCEMSLVTNGDFGLSIAGPSYPICKASNTSVWFLTPFETTKIKFTKVTAA